MSMQPNDLQRSDFIDSSKVDQLIKDHRPVRFIPHTVRAENIYDIETKTTYTRLVLYGVYENGKRGTAIIKDIHPYFYIWVPKGTEPQDLAKRIHAELENLDIDTFVNRTGSEIREYDIPKFSTKPLNITIERNKKFIFFHDYKNNPLDSCLRIEFNTAKQREWAIKYTYRQFETAENESNSFVKVACRDHNLSFNKWAELSNYRRKTDNRYTDSHVLMVSYPNYKILDPQPEQLKKDNMLTLAWDIETYSPDGSLPVPENPNHKIFMIGMSFHWHYDAQPIARIAITDYECDEHPDFKTIACSNEKEIIAAFINLISRMRPDFIIGFNDGNYDWPWVFERAKQYGLLRKLYSAMASSNTLIASESDAGKFFRSKKIKTEAGKTSDIRQFYAPGCIPIDLMIEYKRKFSTLESYSLNSLLKFMNLSLKKDMPIAEMFQIYKNCKLSSPNAENRKLYTLVAEYCVFDSQRVQDLLLRANVILESRAIADLSFVPFENVVYLAGGNRVRNLTYSEGRKQGFLFNSIVSKQTSQFPGGYVVKPRTEFIKPKLSVAELISKYPEWNSMTRESIDQVYKIIQERGPTLTEDELDETGIQEEHVRKFFLEQFKPPITSLDFSSLYPSLMMAYNISPDTIVDPADDLVELQKIYKTHDTSFHVSDNVIFTGHSVSHENKVDILKPDYMFGLFPSILLRLKMDRKRMQNELLKPLGRKIEEMQKVASLENAAEIEEMKFEYMCINSAQLAKKVFMNTYYGESGAVHSPLFLMQVSGGITKYGRENLQKIIEYLKAVHRCDIYYGDTDSCYFTLKLSHYDDLCKEYYSGRLDKLTFMERSVLITQEQMDVLQTSVNDFLLQDNGTRFLTMEYEEVLYPALFLSKKMYLGIPHVKGVNFGAEPFIRGLSSKKRGTSKIHTLKTNDLISRIMDINHRYTVKETICMIIREIYDHTWDPETDLHLFIQTIEYRPTKNNLSVNNFVNRMADKGITIEPNKRIEVVRVMIDSLTIKGTNAKLKKSDYMEPVELVMKHKMPINLEAYFEGGIDGQFASFIAMNEEFNVPTISPAEFMALTNFDRKQHETAINKKRIDKAKKFLSEYRKGIAGDTGPIKISRKKNYAAFATQLAARHGKGVIFGLVMQIFEGDYAIVGSIIQKYNDMLKLDDPDYGKRYIKLLIKRLPSSSSTFKRVRRFYCDKIYYEKWIAEKIDTQLHHLQHLRIQLIDWRSGVMAMIDQQEIPLPGDALIGDFEDTLTDIFGLKIFEKNILSVREAFRVRESMDFKYC